MLNIIDTDFDIIEFHFIEIKLNKMKSREIVDGDSGYEMSTLQAADSYTFRSEGPELQRRRFGVRMVAKESGLKRGWVFFLLWAIYGCLTNPIWDRLGVQLGFDERSFYPGGAGFRLPSSNSSSDLATIQSLVERQTWAIDDSMFDTADKARVGNRTYSVRPPMLAALASSVYFALFMSGHKFATSPGLCNWWLVSMTGGLAVAAASWAVTRCVEILNGKDGSAGLAIAAGSGFGLSTFALPYANAINHHTPAAAATVLAVLAILKIECAKTASPARAALAAGLFAALAFTFDLAGGGIVIAMSLLWMIWSPTTRNRLPAFVVGLAVPIAAHFAMNWSITGDWRPLLVRADAIAASGSSLKPEELSGIARDRSWADYFANWCGLLFGSEEDRFRPRGLLFYVPATILALWNLGCLLVRGDGVARRFAVFVLGSTLLLLVYLAGFTSNFAGNCLGIRWLIILLPGIVIATFTCWPKFNWVGRIAIVWTLIHSGILAWLGVPHGCWQPLELSSWQCNAATVSTIAIAATLYFAYPPRSAAITSM